MSETYSFTVNGVVRETGEDKPLLRYLRDDLRLTSCKDGCSEGACGTCTIVVDGRAMRACIPGMVMSGKALLDANPDPSEAEIKKAIRGNVCRCTGYKKIVEGISLAGAVLRGEVQIDPALEKGDSFGVGDRAFRTDVRPKVLGYGEYPDDVYLDGMVYASAVRSQYPRARVLSIDAAPALALPGVLAVLTADDVPHNKVGHIQQDWDVMIAQGEVTRCVGDAICLVIAESEYILEQAKAAVKVEYEPLEPVRDIRQAMGSDAPKVHSAGNLCQSRHVTRGDAKAALADSKYVVTQSYRTPFTEHAFLEPECAVAFPYKNGVKVWSTDQGVYDTRKEIAIMLGWEPERIVVENKLVGGGFGGKEDVSVQHLAALAALKVGRPVKVKLSRQESINFHPKRHAMEGTFTLGCDENGVFTALDCDIYFDTGAYASLCGPVLERACTHSVGPYCYQNTDIRGYGYYTNNPPAGAFRGFGVCQSEFALESTIDLLAEKVGISPWEIRWRNAIEPGKALPNGQIADCSTALKETLLAVKEAYEANPGRAGIACAMKNAGVGVGLPDKGRCKLVVEEGVVKLYAAASDIGQGCATVFLQILAQTAGLPLEKMMNMGSDSELAPDSGTTSGSRQTLITGEAVRMAAAELKAALDQAGGGLSALEGKEFFAEFFDPTDKLGADKPNPKSHVAYGFATHVVVLDDDGRVKEVWAAHDSGKVVNPTSIQGQIEGGVLMGLGYALTEDFPLKDCVPTARFGTLGLLRADQIPDIHAIYVEKEELLPFAYGAKGIGEIATIPTAPASAEPVQSQPGPITVSDQAGREVTLDAPAERIVSCYYLVTASLLTLGQKDKVVGVELKADSRELYKLAAPEFLDLPEVGSGKETNIEAIAALEPDLVLLPKKQLEAAETLAGLGIPTAVVEPETYELFNALIALLGTLCGCEEQAGALTAYYDGVVERVTGLTKDVERPAVYLAGAASYLRTCAGGMYQREMIEMAGGSCVSQDIQGRAWADVSAEQLAAWDPEAVFSVSYAEYALDDIRGDAALSGLRAVKEDRLYTVPSEIEAWDYPQTSSILGLLWMTHILHPELVSREEYVKEAQEFYQTYFGLEVSEEQLGI